MTGKMTGFPFQIIIRRTLKATLIQLDCRNARSVQWKTPKENAIHYLNQGNDIDLELLQHEDEVKIINRTKTLPPKKFRYKYPKNNKTFYNNLEDVDVSFINQKNGDVARHRLIKSSSRSEIKNGGLNLESSKPKEKFLTTNDWRRNENSERTYLTNPDSSNKEAARREVSPLLLDNETKEVILRNQIKSYFFTSVKNKYMNVLKNLTISATNLIHPVADFFNARFSSYFQTICEDFSETSEEKSIFDQELPQLHFQEIRCNLIRLGNITNPLIEVLKKVLAILRWKNPLLTFIIFTFYMYSVYRGWLINVALLGMVSFFIYSYYLSRKEENSEENVACSPKLGINLSLRNQLAISTYVLRRSQRDTKLGCDMLEKIKNLILWKQPEITRHVFMLICALTVLSFIFSASELLTGIAYFVGIHLFVVSYIFYRFPRLRMKYDKASQIFEQLMTDAMLEEKRQEEAMKANERKKKPLPSNTARVSPMMSSTPTQKSTPTKKNEPQGPFLVRDRFLEIPLSAWKEGRKSMLLTSSRLTEMLSMGLLFLSENLLTFEPITDTDTKSDIYPLRSIAEIEKVNINAYIPGGGQGIKIRIKTTGKVLIFLFQMDIFSTILDRDAAFSSIIEAGKKKRLPWALSAITKKDVTV